jgi:hypothetical protein
MFKKLKDLIAKQSVHEYRANWYSDGRSDRIVTQGDAKFVERYIPQNEFPKLFGGFIRSRSPDGGREFLGVWGRREGSRFRRLLRERGATFEIRRTPPLVRPKIIASITPGGHSTHAA